MIQTVTIAGIDVTDNGNVHVDWESTELGNSFANGQASMGQLVLKGSALWIANNLGAAEHEVVTWEVDGIPLARGRVLTVQVERGPFSADRDVQATFSVGDYNDDLRGLVLLSSVSRPEETDVARVLWALDLLADGSPRADTVLDPSGVINANTVTMEAKTYPVGTALTEILGECAEAAGKTFGVMVDGTFVYLIPGDLSSYVSALSISDRDTEVDNNTVWAPDKVAGIPFTSDSGEVLSDLVFKYGGGESFVTATTPHADPVYWAGTAEDSDVTTSTMAQQVADSIINARDDDSRTYTYAIRPLTADKLGDIMAGQVISQKARVLLDSDDAATFPRIVELRWRYISGIGLWMAIVNAGRPLRLEGFGRRRGDKPRAPSNGTPADPDELYEFLTWDAGEEQWDNAYGGDTGNVLQRSNYYGGAASTTHGGSFGSGGLANSRLAVTAGDTLRVSAYSQGFGESWPCTAHGRINWSWGVRFYTSGNVLISTHTIGTYANFPQDGGWKFNETSALTVPPTAVYLRLADSTDTALGCQTNATHLDQLSIYIVGAAGDPGTTPPSLGGPGEGSFGTPGTYLPADAVIEHGDLSGKGGTMHDASQIEVDDEGGFYDGVTVEAVLQEIAAGESGVTDHGALTGLADNDHPQYRLTTDGGQDVINVVAASGSTETLDLASGNVHDVTLTADCTLTLTGATAGVRCDMAILLRQGTGAPWDVTWPGSVEWVGGSAPTLETAEDAWNWVNLTTLDGGTTWFGDGGAVPVAALDDLTDVTLTSPTTGQYLRYDGSAWVNATPTYAGELLVSDTPAGTPLVFADLLQNEAQDDLIYADAS